MFCPTCGTQLVDGSVFCSACGASTGTGFAQSVTLKRPGLVTLLAVLQFIGAGLSAIVCLLLALPASRDSPPAVVLLAVLFAGAAAIQAACGIGLWKLKPWGRTLQIVLAAFGLLAIPIGTIIAIFTLIYLSKPGIKALFAGKNPSELTPTDLAAIAAATEGSQVATIVVVVLVALGCVAVLGIVAAIAVPGLLRARMAGNEATAIGSLRAINSGEAAYAAAASKGGYAISLAVLAAACPGSDQGFISPELSHDPSFRSGYSVSLSSAGAVEGPPDCNGVRTERDYYATAVAGSVGSTGMRAFSTSASSTIFFDPSGDPPSKEMTLSGSATPLR
jgi:uncharacterized membrane protein (DUF2068 family)